MEKKDLNKLSQDQVKKEFSSIFDRYSRKTSYFDNFNNFLDFSLFIFNVQPSKDEVDKYNSISPEDKETLLYMLECYGILAEGFRDPLGNLFMEYLSSKDKGQFFTPEHICDLMAQVTGKYQDGQSVCDPCCGSGRNLLAVAKIAREAKVTLSYHAADIDHTCVKMTTLNFLIQTMTGEIAWMNTLSLEHWKSYHTSSILHEGHYIPVLRTTGAGETSFTLRYQNSIKTPTPTNIQNGTLTEIATDSIKINSDGQLFLF